MKIAQPAVTRFAIFCFIVALSCSAARAQAPAKPAPPSPRLTPAAVWNPSPDALAAIHAKCAEGEPIQIEKCFLEEMKSAGASPEAVSFSRSLSGTGVIYLRAFRRVAHVDVAYIQYAFRANELEGILLVNGDPSPIDVDDDSQYPQTELQKYPAYAALLAQFPNISIWPADRANPQLPKLDSSWGTETFLVDYLLRDGCHACATVGTATFAFAFNGDGKFQGARVFAVKTASHPAESAAAVAPEFQTAGVEQVRVLTGKDFSITLPANHTTGYSWRLASTLDPAALKLNGTTYAERNTDPNAVGSPGEEVWSFTAGAPGSVPLLFEYARPFDKDAKPVKTSKFLVIIE
ncbi:MAG TPA: protease inhibitor I42 family protein [Candidatus Acidoferrales bacterium]